MPFTRKLRVNDVFLPKSKLTCINLRENTEYRVLWLGIALSLYSITTSTSWGCTRITKLLLCQPLAKIDWTMYPGVRGECLKFTPTSQSRVDWRCKWMSHCTGHNIRIRISRTVIEGNYILKIRSTHRDLHKELTLSSKVFTTNTRDLQETEYINSTFLLLISSSLQNWLVRELSI
jgi:hypothetical protein